MPRPSTTKRLFTMNDPHAMRINADLAKEIGLNESIVLLQFEYLIAQSGTEKDGMLWTYWTLKRLKEYFFKWWSIATISRTVDSLETMGLIYVRSDLNLKGYDRTQWFALNFDGLAKLTSIAVFTATPQPDAILQNETSIFQNETSILQSDDMHDRKMQNGIDPFSSAPGAGKTAPAILQNETTIHESNKTLNESENTRATRAPRSPVPKEPKQQSALNGFHENVQIVKAQFGKQTRLTTAQIDLIVSRDLEPERWVRNVQAYAQTYSRVNVPAMLEWYERDEAGKRQDQQRVNGTSSGNYAALEQARRDREEFEREMQRSRS